MLSIAMLQCDYLDTILASAKMISAPNWIANIPVSIVFIIYGSWELKHSANHAGSLFKRSVPSAFFPRLRRRRAW